MNVRSGFIDSIGNTPLIKLKAASAATGCEIYGKAEFLNPGGSVKDRAALAIIEDAEKRGTLRPGGVIVEGTAGNTGIGIALVANARGYRTVIVMPETQSQEKKDMLRLCGADLRLVPALPYANPGNYVRYSETLAEEIAAKEPNGAIWANQFDNVANRDGHYRTTGPEIWEQTGGKVDGFTCSVGTGGTLAGVALALKERNPGVSIALADPMGSALYNWYDQGRAEGRRQLDHRGHRPGPDHQEPRRRADRHRLPDHRRGSPARPVRPDRARRPGAGRLDGDQHRGRHAARQGSRPGQHHRHHPGRRRPALSVQAVQPGFPAREEPAAAALDDMSRRHMSRVVVCGSLNMDVVVESARRPHAGETLLGAKVSFLPGGKGLNQAVAAARLGAVTAMLGAIGHDAFGNTLRGFLADNDVDSSGVRALTSMRPASR